MEIDKTFKPNTQWMREKYAEMNKLLFNGELGECNFEIFTTGRGSQGSVLGWFKIKNRNIRVDRYSRRMYVLGYNKIVINKNNFAELCNPTIELNGNYSGTENGFLATLVHEMCHYYTYMYGYCPNQCHGREFREIASIVSNKSKGMFTIQRVASAEQMTQLELNDEIKAKIEKRLTNRKSVVSAIIVFTKDGKVKLTITSYSSLIDKISSEEQRRGGNVVVSNNSEVIEYLFSKGYRRNFRTWRYWSIEGKPWIDELKNMLPEVSGTNRAQVKKANPNNNTPKMIFSINTSNGVFEVSCNSFVELRIKLQQRFPNMSYETINKLIGNRANFKKLEENNMNTKKIIKEIIDEFLENEFGGDNTSVEINPDMNLGMYSPLEIQ